MSDKLGEAYIEIRARLDKLEGDLRPSGQKIVGFFGGLKQQLMGMLPFASVAAMTALVSREFGLAAQAARDQTLAEVKLNAALEATGHAAGLAKEDLLDHANAMQKALGIADDEVMNFQATLLGFTNVQGAVFERATDVAADLAVMMGTDMASAARGLGMALNDPINGSRALRQFGIKLTESQTAQVKAMMKAGETTKAQMFLLDLLAKKGDGAAAAFAKTDQGKIKLAKAAIDELRESIGAKLVPWQLMAAQAQLAFVKALDMTLGVANTVLDAYNNLNEAMGGYLTGAIGAAVATMAIAVAIPKVVTAARAAYAAIQLMLVSSGWGLAIVAVGAIAGGIALIVQHLAQLAPVQKWWNIAVERIYMAWNQVSDAVVRAVQSFIQVIQPFLQWLGISWDGTFHAIEDFVATAVEKMLDFVSSFVLEAVEWGIVLFENYDLVWSLIYAGAEYAWLRVLDVVSNIVNAIFGFGIDLADMWVKVWSWITEGAGLAVGGIWDAFKELGKFFGGLVQGIWNAFVWLFSGIAEYLSIIVGEVQKMMAKAFEVILEPSAASNAAAERFAGIATDLVQKKLELEANRRGFAVPEDKKEREKFAPGERNFSTGDKGKKDKLDGFFGPIDFAKRLQESMIKDKTDTLIDIAGGSKTIQEKMLVEQQKLNATLGKMEPIPVADE
jgi:hypothetical protein